MRAQGEIYKHITFTIVSESDPRSMQKGLVRSFRRLRQRSFWSNLVSGGIYVLEITGRPGKWHVHIHVLCSALRIPWHRLRREWQKVSNGRGVYIQNIPKKAMVAYLTKYVTKSSIPPRFQRIASDALRGAHLFTVFGCFHSLRKDIPKLIPHCPECGEAKLEILDFLHKTNNHLPMNHVYVPSPP